MLRGRFLHEIRHYFYKNLYFQNGFVYFGGEFML